MIRIICGDSREELRRLPDASVHMVVTSPPYWGLRDYNVAGQIGLEASPDAFVAEMVSLFREVRRVLRDDGTLWLNLGDSYAASRGAPGRGGPPSSSSTLLGNGHVGGGPKISARSQVPAQPGDFESDLKPKDLIGIPWLVAFALRADGWYLRSDIIWSKPNPMPESVTDRPTNAHEHVFLLTKSGASTFWAHRDGAGTRTQPDPDYRWIHRDTGAELTAAPEGWPDVGKKDWRRVNLWTGRDYFYDQEAIAEPSSPGSHARMSQDVERQIGSFRANGGAKSNGPMKAVTKKMSDGSGFPTRNARNVWSIVTESFSEAHFATFPTELAERCVKAGSSERGCCVVCGAPWTRAVTKGEPDMAHRRASGADASGGYNGQSVKDHDSHGVQNASDVKRRILEGMREKTFEWRASCQCNGTTVPCTVLDPFAGAFTSLLVADRLQRNGIGVELNPEYCAMAERRLTKEAPLFTEIARPKRGRLFTTMEETP